MTARFDQGDRIVGLSLTIQYVKRGREVLVQQGNHRMTKVRVSGRAGRAAFAIIDTPFERTQRTNR